MLDIKLDSGPHAELLAGGHTTKGVNRANGTQVAEADAKTTNEASEAPEGSHQKGRVF